MIDISWPTYFAYPLGLSSGGGLSVTDDLFFPRVRGAGRLESEFAQLETHRRLRLGYKPSKQNIGPAAGY